MTRGTIWKSYLGRDTRDHLEVLPRSCREGSHERLTSDVQRGTVWTSAASDRTLTGRFESLQGTVCTGRIATTRVLSHERVTSIRHVTRGTESSLVESIYRSRSNGGNHDDDDDDDDDDGTEIAQC